MNNRWQQ